MPWVRQELASTRGSPSKQTNQRASTPNLGGRKRGPSPTPVFDAYWRFAAERQRIFRNRLLGCDWSTEDTVLQKFRFTNAYRASDRVSQYLIQRVIYDREREWKDIFLRVVLFKLFNKVETWSELENEVGTVSHVTFDVDTFTRVLDRIRGERRTIYSAAYIMPSAGTYGSRKKHVNHLRLLHHMLETRLDERLLGCQTADAGFRAIVEYPSIGPFLAYQLLTDLSYSSELPFEESEFVAPGPGALDGLHKCFSDPGDFTASELIAWTMCRQRDEFDRLGIAFEDLWGRPLQLIDCQNLYCEISKYARAAFPQVRGSAARTRIKQVFRPRSEPISAWYPPKWGINERVDRWFSEAKTA